MEFITLLSSFQKQELQNKFKQLIKIKPQKAEIKTIRSALM